ncbi:cupin domain-containing protein [Candidatus Nitrospira nitrificans]|uniref:ChrR-like cupin domain-containing protein n=1 Tax=Candidatus Nitrospira nitrificans TaxID=1742973 RepID=A0A0S4LH32_9BACT|nr:cupin domain-containing protein [Candidatus Nitrospira nitrificans]CUS36821.1 hypothetical protein COMA2_270025 [Candidatus Nitrospira nitrificans]
MTETKLPEELEEQAMLYALGILDEDDRPVFMASLQGEAHPLRQATRAYQATTEVLAEAVAPITPPSALRERLVKQVALEAAREAEQFELAADTLALGVVPLTPRASVRERLLSRIEGQSDIRLENEQSVRGLSETPVLVNDAGRTQSERPLSREGGALSSWLRSCRAAVSNFLRVLAIRSVTSERLRYWKAKMTLQQPTKGLTFIKATEGVWREIAPGVTAKLLAFDPVSRRTTALLRFASGTRYAPHRHTEVEELYVLEGGCSIAGREMTVGDYHRAEAGTEHYDTSTDDGCVLLAISSPQNELLP